MVALCETTALVRHLAAAGWSIDDLAVRSGLSPQQVRQRLDTGRMDRLRLYARQVTVKLDAAMHDQLVAMADADGCTSAETIRQVLEWGLESCGS